MARRIAPSKNRIKLLILASILLNSTLLGGAYISSGFQTGTQLSSSPSVSCPLTSFISNSTIYIKNCYYEVGTSTKNGQISYIAITDGSNVSLSNQAGLLSEELDIGNNLGGYSRFTSATESLNVNTPDIMELSVVGKITNSSSAGQVMLQGTRNIIFFANEPYFIASLNSTIEITGPYNSHDIANYLNPYWNNEWVAPGINGTPEVCNSNGCSTYIIPESTTDTTPGDLKSLIQTSGPTWGWLGHNSSTSAEGIGFLLLGLNSTNPDETFITHYELNAGRFEIEGAGAAPADPTSNQEDPHALVYASDVPQKMYASFLVYVNNTPYTSFEDFISGFWKADVMGSYLGSSEKYAAFAEQGQLPNNNAQPWFITNLATSVSAPQISAIKANFQDAMLYFTGRNNSLSNDFPLKMYLNINGSTKSDWNFGDGAAKVLTSDGTNAGLQVVWTDTKDHLQLIMIFNTKSNSDKMNVTGYLQTTSGSVDINSLSLQANVYDNFLDGTGPPDHSPTSISDLSWDWINGASSVGVSIVLPSDNNGNFTDTSFPNSTTALLNLPASPTFTKSPIFSFAVSFYDPISDFNNAYTEKIYVPTMKIFTQPLGNANQVGFTEDSSQLFSYLLSANEFDSNRTIAAMQLLPFTGDLEVYYSGFVSPSIYVKFSNGTSEPALPFFDSHTKVFNFNVVSITQATLFFVSVPTSTTDVSCSPPTVAKGSSTTCTADIDGVEPTGTVSWEGNEPGTFSPDTCTVSSGSCSVVFTPNSSMSPVTITAQYSGDSNNLPSSGNFSLDVPKEQPPGVAVFCSPSNVTLGSSSACIATVAGSSPTGTVTFSSTDPNAKFSPSSSCSLSSSSDSCQVTYMPSKAGPATITASYAGDSNNLPTSGNATLIVRSSTSSSQSGTGSSFSFSLPAALIIGSVIVAVTMIGVSVLIRRRPIQ
jgi:hypothetical protein